VDIPIAAVLSPGPLIHVGAITYAVYRQPLVDGAGLYVVRVFRTIWAHE
jgi:hypothetical protein